MSLKPKIRVMLADDHQIVRQGLRLLLEGDAGLELVGEAADGMTAVSLAEKLQPDVLVVDLMIPRLHGLEVVRQVRRDSPKTRIIVLSMHADEPYVAEALRNGASGYVLKDSSGDDLIKGIHAIMKGQRYLSAVLANRAMTDYGQRPGESSVDVYDTLTSRERQVLQLAASGLSSPELARQLFISPRTAETHRANLMRKLSLGSQTDLVRFAIRKGIISA